METAAPHDLEVRVSGEKAFSDEPARDFLDDTFLSIVVGKLQEAVKVAHKAAKDEETLGEERDALLTRLGSENEYTTAAIKKYK